MVDAVGGDDFLAFNEERLLAQGGRGAENMVFDGSHRCFECVSLFRWRCHALSSRPDSSLFHILILEQAKAEYAKLR